MNLGLKAGTNSIHGTAYAFGRDGAWDALNFFQPLRPAQVPSLSFEQYAATAGGPIIKDKLFWFVGYEAQMGTPQRRANRTPVSDGASVRTVQQGQRCRSIPAGPLDGQLQRNPL